LLQLLLLLVFLASAFALAFPLFSALFVLFVEELLLGLLELVARQPVPWSTHSVITGGWVMVVFSAFCFTVRAFMSHPGWLAASRLFVVGRGCRWCSVGVLLVTVIASAGAVVGP